MDRGDDLPLTLGEVDELVSRGDVTRLTCDVFDTLVWRAVAVPADALAGLADRVRTAGADRFAFRAARIEAERRARERTMIERGTVECTLAEIWSEMPDTVDVDDGVLAEIELETDCLRVHPSVAATLAGATAARVPVTLVSDTYLSAEQLRSVLTAVGVPLDGVGIVTSSDRRRNKWDGLLADVVAEMGGPDGAVHIGDNPASDIEAARRAGIRPCHVDLDVDTDVVNPAAESWLHRSAAVGSDGGRSAAVRETFVRAGIRSTDPAYQFGVGVAGPLMVGFAGWAATTAEQLGASAIHCLLREGARIAELIDVVHPGAPERVPIHASRWAIMRAAVIDGTPRELERALARRVDLRADHVGEAFGVDVREVTELWGSATISLDRRRSAYRALAADDSLREQIVARSAELRTGTVRYLLDRLRLDDGPIVMCDIGWGATIQEGITDIIRSAGVDQQVIGLYSLLSPAGEIRAGLGTDARCYLPLRGRTGQSTESTRTIVRVPELLERINTPRLGTLLGFDDDGEPVTRDADHDPFPESLGAAQAGVGDFAAVWAELATDAMRQEWFTDPDHAACAAATLASVIRSPDPLLAGSLGRWTHDDVAGTAHETLTGERFARWAPYANAVDSADISMHDVFWVAGAASAARSPLSVQLAALAAGHHPDVVCPPSPTGTARIAVFPAGSTLAHAQTERHVRQGAGGWMLLQLDTAVPSLRSIRLDVGDIATVVEFADVDIVATTDTGSIRLAGSVDELRPIGRWVHGAWSSTSRASVSPDGHLLIDLDDSVAATVESVSVSVAFRTSPAGPDDLRAGPTGPIAAVTRIVRTLGGRARRIVRRARGR